MTLDIAIDADAEWDSSSDWASLARSAAAAAIAESAFPQLGQGDRAIELSVRLTSDDQVHALNAQWRGKDKPTNVLSFPMDEEEELEAAAKAGPELMLGISSWRAASASRRQRTRGAARKPRRSPDGAWTLHLLGCDHMDEGSAADMEAREVQALARIGISDPCEGDR
jgi:probable rRNA maturation factor